MMVRADVALMNGGSIRADEIIKAGALTRRDVLSILPFKNKVVKVEVSGATLHAVLEHGVARSAEDAESAQQDHGRCEKDQSEHHWDKDQGGGDAWKHSSLVPRLAIR